MSIENIFSPDPSFRQSQYHKLSDNVNDWDEQIYGILAGVIPKRLGLKNQLHWQKVDDNKGYAVGSMVLSEQSGRSIGVPLIVKQWHLAPVDTMLIGDKAYPLTADTLKEVFTGEEISTETISKHSPGSLFDAGSMQENAYPPSGGGRYVYSSDQGSLLEQVMATAWEEDLDELRKTAEEDPSILAAYARRGTLEIVKAAAKKKGKKPKKGPSRKRNIFQVNKKSVNEFSILGNSSGVFDPLMQTVDRPTMCKFVASVAGPGEAEREFVSRVDKNREEMITLPNVDLWGKRNFGVGEPEGQHGNIFMYDTKSGRDPKAKKIDKFGIYGVKDSAGVTSYGYLFPHVVNFDSKKLGIKLFVGKNVSSAQETIVGFHEPDREVGLPETDTDPGKTGTLVYFDGGRALATMPFRIISSSVMGGSKTVKVEDFFGRPATLMFSDFSESMTKMDKSKSLMSSGPTYLIPSKMRFVELGPNKQIPSSVEEHEKHASGRLDSNPLKVIRSNGKYIFKAAGLDKYANVNNVGFDFDNLDQSQAKFLLASFGCPAEKIASLLRRKDSLQVEIHGLDFPKVASSNEPPSYVDGFIRSLRVNLVKEASAVEDAEVVDTALSLGFINPENIGKFIEAVPRLKECISLLSKLLLGARMGMKNIPEEATASAIQSIMKVIDGLRRLGLIRTEQTVQ